MEAYNHLIQRIDKPQEGEEEHQSQSAEGRSRWWNGALPHLHPH